MIIDTVEISNLGLWENIFLKFDKGINIIQGENGAGKTTLLALLYSLFRDSGIIKFTNENQEAYVCMNLQNYKEKLVLKKVYKKGQSGYFAYSARTAHPFQRNGAPFRFRLSKAQQVY